MIYMRFEIASICPEEDNEEWYLDTCMKDNIIFLSQKRFCSFRVRVKIQEEFIWCCEFTYYRKLLIG